jgi:hypothetical protein
MHMVPVRVVIESPLAGDVERNTRYAQAAMRDSLARGEAPFASHLLYTQVLDDLDPAQREQGIQAGFAWHDAAEKSVAYTDLGVSDGMKAGIESARAMGIPVEYRTIPNWGDPAMADTSGGLQLW